MSLDFTVAIPTYNGAKRLPQLLDRLRSQTQIDSLAWEILIVDNNSRDETAAVVQALQADWSHPFPLRYCFEPEQGAAFARQRAVREAQGVWIGFLDDDNLPAPDWLASAVQFSQRSPQLGAFSGPIRGDFEVAPPANFEKIQGFLAIRDHGPEPMQFDAARLRLPPAASLVIRKQAWLEAVPARQKLTGKLPGRLIQGDDYEPLLHLHRAGWQIWYNPGMQTFHQIPRQRLERAYLLELARGCGLATCQLRMISAASDRSKPIVLLKGLLGDLNRAGRHWLTYRHCLQTDLIPACEMSFHVGCVLSTVLYLKQFMHRPD